MKVRVILRNDRDSFVYDMTQSCYTQMSHGQNICTCAMSDLYVPWLVYITACHAWAYMIEISNITVTRRVWLVVWLRHMCTRAILMHTCHDSFISVTCLIHMYHNSSMWHIVCVGVLDEDWFIRAWYNSTICAHVPYWCTRAMTYSCWCHIWFICAMTHLIYVCHDSFMSRFTNVRVHAPESQIDWRIHARCPSFICAYHSFLIPDDMCIALTYTCVCTMSWLNLVSHLREGTCVVSNETMTHTCMTWNQTVTHACMTDAFVHMCHFWFILAMTYPCQCHVWIICATRLIHVYFLLIYNIQILSSKYAR